jgi:hypothetical protein
MLVASTHRFCRSVCHRAHLSFLLVRYIWMEKLCRLSEQNQMNDPPWLSIGVHRPGMVQAWVAHFVTPITLP